MVKENKESATPLPRFDFNKAVEDSLRHYPKLAENTVFVDSAHDNWQGLEIGANEKSSLDPALEKSRREDISFTSVSHIFNLQAMIYKPRENRAVLFEEVEADRHAIFDHELSHLAIKDANRRTKFYPLDESICDSYAMLRHLQRSNNETTDTDFCGWKRALDTIDMKTATHLTSFAVDKIIVDAASRDFISLTREETAGLAHKYAKAHTPKEEDMRGIINHFAPLWGELRTITPDNLQPIRELARLTLQLSPSSPAFYVGHRVLAGFLNRKARGIVLEGQEWDKIREKLREKYKGLDHSSPLMTFGLKN